MNALRKISIDTVLLALAVALCLAALALLGGAARIAALGVGVFVAAQEAPQATKPPRSCATCSRPLRAWQLRFDGGAELRCGRYDCAAKDKLVATREVQADGTVRETAAATFELPAGATLIGLDDNAGIFGATTVDVPALYDQIERQAAEIAEYDRIAKSEAARAVNAENERDSARAVIERQAAEIERLKAQRGLTSEEMAIVERTRALVRERDELLNSVDLLDEQGRKMKAERDAALLEVAALKLSVSGVRSAFADGEASERRKRDSTIERLQGELDAARAEIQRMKPLVEAALKWDEEGASDDELLQAAQDYRDAEEGAS